MFSLAAIAAAALSAAPAAAESVSASAQAKAHGVILQPLTLTRIEDLDFGTVIASSTAGTVTINADTSARTTTGGVTGVPNYPGQRGLFGGAGTAFQPVVLTLKAPSVLVSESNPSDIIEVEEMVLDNNNQTDRTINSTAAFFVGVGGTFNIAASQPNGSYSAPFELTAEYQ
ncbi:MAG TPA: DUF4402 domain-containing protein [Sphingomicrobium sp.]|nr:DUF4402 domain-containing protein [Sphingomicrobium sp.]